MRFKKIVEYLKAIPALLILFVSTSIFFIPILLLGLAKLIPHLQWRIYCTQLIDQVVVAWSLVNIAYIKLVHKIKWDISQPQNFDKNNWYLIVSNHQSWLDIVVLLHVFTNKIPNMKFFIKDQLKWVPLLGFAWWAMGCPFMKRYSKDYLARNPHKKIKDLKATTKAMHFFSHHPTSIINFVEGTRFTREKKALQQSPYQHLLKPKAGGVSFVLDIMDKKITSIIDVSIVYPDPHFSLWNFLCHRMNEVKVSVREIPLPSFLTQNLSLDEEQKQLYLRNWLNEEWLKKDKIIDDLRKDIYA